MSEPALTFRMKRPIGSSKRTDAPAWVRELVAEAAHAHKVPVFDVFGPCRTAPASRARDMAIHAIRTSRPSLSWTRIADMFGRDHTTAMDSFRRHAKRVEEGACP